MQVANALAKASKYGDDKEMDWFMQVLVHTYEELGDSALGVEASVSRRMHLADIGRADMLN